MNPMKRIVAASLPSDSGYIFPVIFGHQKWMPAKIARHHPAHHHEVEVRDDEIGFSQMDVHRPAKPETARSVRQW